jgi:hypothetical protein
MCADILRSFGLFVNMGKMEEICGLKSRLPKGKKECVIVVHVNMSLSQYPITPRVTPLFPKLSLPTVPIPAIPVMSENPVISNRPP